MVLDYNSAAPQADDDTPHDYRADFRHLSAREITLALRRGQWRDGEGSACCPAHEDRSPSLSISAGRDGAPLVYCHAGCSQAEVLAALRRLGLWPEGRDGHGESPRARPKPPPPQPDTDPAAYARQIWRDAVPIAGTIAGRYLREHRGIAGPLPEGLRFSLGVKHAELGRYLPALIVPAFDDTGALRRVQAVFLDPLTGGKAAVPNPKKHGKKTFGRAASHLPAVFPGAHGGRFDVVLVEGPEDAITLRSVIEDEGDVAASLGAGSLHRPRFAPGTRLLIVADGDAPGARAAQKAATAHAIRGCMVSIAAPPADIKDANELLRQRGPAAVLAMRDAAEPFVPKIQAAVAGLKAREAAGRVRAAIERFFRLALAWDPEAAADPLDYNDPAPPVHAIRASIGVGKSRAVLAQLVDPALAALHVNFYAPRHKLNVEMLEDFNRLAKPGSPRARLVLGRNQILPDGTPMCAKAELAHKLGAVGKTVQTTLCARRRDDGETERCEHFATCPYQQQRADKEPGVRFLSHSHGFVKHHKPDVAIFDESFWRASLRGCSGRGVFIPLWRLRELRDVPRRDGMGRDDNATADLAATTARCLRAIEAGGTLADYLAAGVTEDAAHAARVLEYRRVERLDVSPGMPEALQKSRIDAYQAHEALKFARYFRLLAQCITASVDPMCLEVRTAKNGDGAPEARLYMAWSVSPKIGDVPTLMIDAALEEVIARRFFPRMDAPEIIDAELVHYHATQITDRRVAKAMLVPEPEGDGDPEWRHRENRRRANRRAELRQLVEVEASKGKTLLVSYKGAVEAIEAEGPIPNASFAHFNALRGRDQWRDIGTLIVAGCTQPNEFAVERMARALFYLSDEPIEGAGSQYQHEPRLITMADGRTVPVAVDVHPDPRCTMLLDQIRAEVLQAIGRARLVHRDPARPCRVIILTNYPLPMPVHETATWEELMPNPIDVMAARNVIPLRLRDVAKVLPELVTSGQADPRTTVAESLKAAGVDLGELSRFPYRDSTIGESGQFAVYRYRLAGERKSATAWVNVARADPRTALESFFGPLFFCELVEKPSSAGENERAAAEPPPLPEPPEPEPSPPAAPEPPPAPEIATCCECGRAIDPTKPETWWGLDRVHYDCGEWAWQQCAGAAGDQAQGSERDR